ncbi:MAG: rod shape-determining protein MreC [Campylobacterota bacterium]
MRKFLFFVLLFIIGLSYLFEIDKIIARKFTFLSDIKSYYINTVVDISSTVEKYFNQLNEIQKLQEENEALKNYKTSYLTIKNEYENLKEFLDNNTNIQDRLKTKQTRVLSYVDFHDFTKVWLDYDKKDDSILGLISNNYAAGIVIKQDNKAVGLLNGNSKCSYAVFIGKNETPGIIISNKNSVPEIRYIPLWSDISVGDEVVTSGMDNIFVKGLKVGKITKIQNKSNMKTASIEMYANVLKSKYFYVYKNNKNLENKNQTTTTTNK